MVVLPGISSLVRYPCKPDLQILATEENSHVRFRVALETHENLLHAETQAIAAKHLDTIEEILDKKDQSLEILISTKENLPDDFQNDAMIISQMDRVLELQERNAASFKRFFDERSRREKGLEEKLSSNDRRLRKTYLNPNR